MTIQPDPGAACPRIDTDIVVVGAGIAGLSFALRLPDSFKVVLITKGALGESNTWYAQGGLAAAIGPDDDPDLHFADTLAAGAGLCDEDAVRILVEQGPAAVRWLIDQGTAFDRTSDAIALGREAAHSRNRVIHAGGDATGAEIERSLVAQLRSRSTVTILEHTSAIDLVTNADGSCAGAYVINNDAAVTTMVAARITVLANGGAGRLWHVTSNPPGATGDGIAMAHRAGAALADLEFTQFHPTVLAGPGIEPFLITEAIRGEGAYLRSAGGERFMATQHELAELAPRDVVARAIEAQIAIDRQPVSLDVRHLDSDMIRSRFPTILAHLERHGLSLTDDLIPVAPAAHYFMGGIVANTAGQTSLPGLLAIGEVSCTGVHGANRLASNSLLEGLVFGLRAADRIADVPEREPDEYLDMPQGFGNRPMLEIAEIEQFRESIQQIMSRYLAVVRDRSGLDHACVELAGILETVEALDCLQAAEIQNMALLANGIARSALLREESRGGHYRSDFPGQDPHLDSQHQLVDCDDEHSFGPLTTILPA